MGLWWFWDGPEDALNAAAVYPALMSLSIPVSIIGNAAAFRELPGTSRFLTSGHLYTLITQDAHMNALKPRKVEILHVRMTVQDDPSPSSGILQSIARTQVQIRYGSLSMAGTLSLYLGRFDLDGVTRRMTEHIESLTHVTLRLKWYYMLAGEVCATSNGVDAKERLSLWISSW